jgi:aminoglycoside phosphotransferase family enzyme/predicted kinase
MQKKLIEELKNPSTYGSDVDTVDVLQTHISFIALTGKYAYKIKKPVDFGFLDFSTLKKRKYFCEEEVRLNRRLCPDIYLDVVPLTCEDDKLVIGGGGQVVDYAVKMKEFSQEQIMTNLLQREKVHDEIIRNICQILVDFYNASEKSKEIDKFGQVESIKKNIDENFEQTEQVINITIPRNMYRFIKKINDDFLKERKSVFQKRIKDERIKDCHGDLHSGNIVLSDKIYIFDCIEFNKRFRYCDVASDIGFLAMDLDYQNYPFLSSYLINLYVEKSGDKDIFKVLNFYKSYRAYVRGKVIGFRLNDSHVEEREKDAIIKTSKKYYYLAHYYASLISIDLHKDRPIIFIVSGLSGTGKSTLASKLSVDYNASYLNSDIIRKEIAGIDRYERHLDSIDTGLYQPEKIDFTYKKVIEKTDELLKKGHNVVLDATFQIKKYRDMAKEIADENNAIFILIQTTAPDNIVKNWLDVRLKKKTVSDGRWEVYLNQKKTFEPYLSQEKPLIIDMSQGEYKPRLETFWKILKRVQGDI